ncbi:MAG: 2-phosphosulfolactate phosphatase [Desertimonas sp.]
MNASGDDVLRIPQHIIPSSRSRLLARDQLDGVTGPVVVIDTIRAFTTAAYAFAAGAAEIVLVDTVDDALAYKAAHPGVLAMGEDRGLRPEGFDFPNSPALVSRADLTGRTLVQRTSAGTRGVVAARSADRLWAASLVCASATARAVEAAGLGAPSYVITGWFPDRPGRAALDDVLTAELIERARLGQPLDAEATAAAVQASEETVHTLALGAGHVDPDDIVLATRVDAFEFAMEVHGDGSTLRLRPS